jgi:hypothetical protein
MAKKWIHLTTDIAGERYSFSADTDVEWDADEADRLVAAGSATAVATPPQKATYRGPAPESAMADPAAERAVKPAAAPKKAPPKAPPKPPPTPAKPPPAPAPEPAPVPAPKAGGPDDDDKDDADDEPAVND